MPNRVHAQKYFRFDPAREAELRALDALIRAAAPPLARVCEEYIEEGTRPEVAAEGIMCDRFRRSQMV